MEILQIVKKIHSIDESDDKFVVEKQEGGLFNKVCKVTFALKTWYVKQYIIQNNSIVFTPPKISPEIRAKLAYNVQKKCHDCNQTINTVPNLHIDTNTHTLVIDGIENAVPLIDYISNNDIHILHGKLISMTIANLHQFYSTSNCRNEDLYLNKVFKDFKLNLQYTQIAAILDDKYSKTIIDLLKRYESQTITVLHGDLNSRNIVVNKTNPSTIGIIDFEQSHVGNPIYDIAYFLSEIYISCLYFNEERTLKTYVDTFIKTYSNIYPQFNMQEYAIDLKLHLAVQIIYRFLGPSKQAWTYYIKNNTSEAILNYAKDILATGKEEIIDSVLEYH